MSAPSIELPRKATWGGYIYIIEFSNGTVKVGSTIDPPARFSAHRGSASAFGITISRWWISVEHLRHLETEQQLIALAESMNGQRARREYFTGVDFDDLAARANRRIRYPNRGSEAARTLTQTRREANPNAASRCGPPLDRGFLLSELSQVVKIDLLLERSGRLVAAVPVEEMVQAMRQNRARINQYRRRVA